jgi:hypothetical protein
VLACELQEFADLLGRVGENDDIGLTTRKPAIFGMDRERVGVGADSVIAK